MCSCRKKLFIPELLQRNVKALGSLLLLLVIGLAEDHHLRLSNREKEREGLRSNCQLKLVRVVHVIHSSCCCSVTCHENLKGV